jgi:WD40 repeat protein
MMKSPFKFLDAYQKKDRDIFFGRDKDIELLYETTYKTDLLLLYGQSGTGKTSLIQCGLASRFREADWFDLYIRRRGDINASLHRKVREKAETPIDENATVGKAIQSLYLDHLKPIYLIFDQFEELFILGTPKEQQEFFQTIAQLLKGTPGVSQNRVSCKIIFVMREEYIARLYDFEKVVPELFDYRIRVETMNLANVEAVIKSSAQAFDIRLESPVETVEYIINNNKDHHGTIHLPYLQVYLDRLYREAARTNGSNANPVFTPALVNQVGKISDVMAAFLDEQTGQIQQLLNDRYPEVPKDQVWQVLTQFVSYEGTNSPRTKEALYSKLPLSKEVIDFCLTQLESARILHVSEQDKTYEIAHDALAKHIDEKRSTEEKTLLRMGKLIKDRFTAYKDTAVLLTKKELSYIELYVEKLKSKLNAEEINFIAKSREKASKRRTIIALGLVAVSLNLLLTAVAIWGWKTATKQKTIASAEAKIADSNKFAFEAKLEVEKDPTIALLIAEEAMKLNKNEITFRTINEIYGENTFYKVVKYGEEITSAAYSSKKKMILTVSTDNTARLWDLQGNMKQEFEGHEKKVNCVAFSRDGNYILTGSKNGTARLWDLQGNMKQEFDGHEKKVNGVAFSPEGKYILTGSADKTARLWDLEGNVLQVFKGHKEHDNVVISVAFSPDGNYILTGSENGTARLWDLQGNMKQEFEGHEKKVNGVAFSPNGKTILIGSENKTARLWDLQGNMIQEFKGHTHYVSFVAFSPDGKYILTGSKDNTVRLWQWQRFPEQEFKGHEEQVNCVAFSPDGNYILTGSADRTARLWGLQGNMKQEFEGHEKKVNCVAFSPDGNYILTGSADKTARLWDLQGKQVRKFEGHDNVVTSVAFSPDGNYILTGSTDKTARLWDLQGKMTKEFKGHEAGINSVAFSPDGKYILTGLADSTARLWNRENSEELEVFKGHKYFVNSVAFSPDGKYILTGSADNTVRLWDLQGKEVQVFNGHDNVVTSVAFSPDGKNILTGSWDKTARLWDLEGNELQIFRGHDDVLNSVAFSPDGKTILTGSLDKTALLWKTPMPLEEFLEKGNFEQLTDEQKKEFGIKD